MLSAHMMTPVSSMSSQLRLIIVSHNIPSRLKLSLGRIHVFYNYYFTAPDVPLNVAIYLGKSRVRKRKE